MKTRAWLSQNFVAKNLYEIWICLRLDRRSKCYFAKERFEIGWVRKSCRWTPFFICVTVLFKGLVNRLWIAPDPFSFVKSRTQLGEHNICILLNQFGENSMWEARFPLPGLQPIGNGTSDAPSRTLFPQRADVARQSINMRPAAAAQWPVSISRRSGVVNFAIMYGSWRILLKTRNHN